MCVSPLQYGQVYVDSVRPSKLQEPLCTVCTNHVHTAGSNNVIARKLICLQAENTAREAAASDAGLEMQDAATTGVAGDGAAPPDSSEEGRPPRGPPGDRSWHGRPEGPRRRAVPRPGSAGQTSDQSRSHPVPPSFTRALKCLGSILSDDHVGQLGLVSGQAFAS